jgi:polyphosphate kinase 2 (PPK2 family)
MTLNSITKRFRIDSPDKFRLSEYDPDDCQGLTKDKNEAKAMLAEGIEQLVELQERLYADDRWSVLIILQAMDAAGKDGVIKHVMSGLNPARRRGASLQAAECRGDEPQFSLARSTTSAGARAHRHFQSLILREGFGRSCTPGTTRAAEVAKIFGRKRHMAAAFR